MTKKNIFNIAEIVEITTNTANGICTDTSDSAEIKKKNGKPRRYFEGIISKAIYKDSVCLVLFCCSIFRTVDESCKIL